MMDGNFNRDYLEIAKSVRQIRWQRKSFDSRLSLSIEQKFGLSHILSSIIASRNIDLDNIESFLDPKIKNSLPDPFGLTGVKKAVDYVTNAIKGNKKITIYADYDVDGATSAAILHRFFNQINFKTNIYIPDRIKEGYGPNVQALLKLKEEGTDLVFTLDCGAVSFEPLLAAKKAGLDIIVIDHHIGMEKNPEAIAIINPNSFGEKFIHKNLCAAGVTFLFIVALNQKLRHDNFYKNEDEPNLIDLLDLVALGTVCDVMSLQGINRVFVKQGLKILKSRKNVGIKTICDLANIDEEPNSYHLGFVIGPRINAGGRIGDSDLGAKLLSTNDEIEAFEIAQKLEQYNLDRKKIENDAIEEAIANLEDRNQKFNCDDPIIFATSYDWHQGIIGIVASRLKEKYNKPSIVITIDRDTKIGKASCRSINGINLGNEIINAKYNNLLIDGGGHAMAAGFSVKESRIDELHNFFCTRLKSDIDEITNNRIEPYDIEIDLSEINLNLIDELKKLEPFGVGNPQPKFMVKNVRIANSKLMGRDQSHISCIFCSKNNFNTNQIKAVLFNGVNSDLAHILLAESYNKEFNVIGNITINKWMGIESLQLIIEDIII